MLALAASVATAQDRPADWKGELVVGKKSAKGITFGKWVNDKYEQYTFRGIYPITVREDRDGWLRVFDGHREAWAKKDEFVLSKDAPAYFTDRIRADPKDTFAWWMRGWGWYDREEYDNAIKDLTECIRLDPRDADSFSARGAAWAGKREYDRAIQDYDEAIQLDPTFEVAFKNRGNAWRRKADFDRAIKDYDTAIRLDPKYATAYSNRGLTWLGKGDTDRALKDHDEAVRINPKNLVFLSRRSVALLVARRPGAVDGCRQVIEAGSMTGGQAARSVIVGTIAARMENDNAAAKWFLAGAGKLKAEWPEPIVRYLRGDLDEPGLLKLATDKDNETEARAYLGLDHAIRGNREAARAHFRWVKDEGEKARVPYTLAVTELARLEKRETPKE